MRNRIKKISAAMAGVILCVVSCSANVGDKGDSSTAGEHPGTSSFETPRTDSGSFSVTLDSGRRAKIEITRYAARGTTWDELPSILPDCVKHGDYNRSAYAIQIVQFSAKVTFLEGGGNEKIKLFPYALATNSKNPMDQFRPVPSCESGSGSIHLSDSSEFTRNLLVLEFANNSGQLILSPEKIFFSLASENGSDPLARPHCDVEGGSGSPREDFCVLGLSQ